MNEEKEDKIRSIFKDDTLCSWGLTSLNLSLIYKQQNLPVNYKLIKTTNLNLPLNCKLTIGKGLAYNKYLIYIY